MRMETVELQRNKKVREQNTEEKDETVVQEKGWSFYID
jgi:hypothetical protein